MKIVGIVLIVLGALALAYGGISYTKKEKVVDIGPIEATAEHREHLQASAASLMTRPARSARDPDRTPNRAALRLPIRSARLHRRSRHPNPEVAPSY